MTSAIHAQVDDVRESLIRARRLLCEPSAVNLQLACGVLASAQRAIESVRAEAERQRSIDRAVASAVSLLRNEIGVIAVLLDRAAAFHANLLERMVAASQTPPPDSAAVRAHSRVLVEA